MHAQTAHKSETVRHEPKIEPEIESTPDRESSQIYELVTKHFLACCSKDAVGHQTKVRRDMPNTTSTCPVPPPSDLSLPREAAADLASDAERIGYTKKWREESAPGQLRAERKN